MNTSIATNVEQATETVFEDLVPLIKLGVIVLVLLIVVNIALIIFRNRFAPRFRNKKQRSSFILLIRVLKYVLSGMVILFSFWGMFGSVKEMSFFLGIVSVGLGFALQKPITGFVVWMGLLVKRPFEIGDRISVGGLQGNVVDVTMSHVYLDEVGRYGGEELSGRTILIPNATLLDKDLINYSYRNDHVLGQVVFSITYESDIDEAIRLGLESAHKHVAEYEKHSGKKTLYRMEFKDSGIELKIRYFAPFSMVQETMTRISYDLHKAVAVSRSVEMAYPHIEIVPRKGEDA